MKKWHKIIVLSLCVLLVSFYAWPQCQKIIYRVQLNLKEFILLKADYEQLYGISPLYRMIKEIKNALPRNAKIALSPPSNQFGFKYIIIRYQLYPCILSRDWSYFIDTDHSMRDPPPADLKAIRLPSGIRIFARMGHPWRMSTQNYHGKLLGRNLFLFLGLSLWLVLIGSLILKGLAIRPIKGNGSWFFSSAYLLGLLVFCISLWCFLMLGKHFNQMTVFVHMVFISIMSFLFSRSRISGQHMPPLDKPRSMDGPKRMVEYFSDGISLFIIFLFMGIIISIPVSVWDEMFIWIIKARNFCAHQGLDFSYTLPTNNYYPILWPLNNAFYFLLIGDYDEISKWISALTFFAFLAQLKGCLFFLGIKRQLLWPLVAAYLILFHHWTFYTALPENLFMALLMAMTTWIIVCFKDPLHSKKYMTLGLIMALGLTLVKFEGAITACLGGLSLILMPKNAPSHKKDYLYGGLFLVLLLIPWGWSHWVQSQGNEIVWYHLQGRPSAQNINIMINIVSDSLMKTKIFFLIGPALLSILVLHKHRPWAREEKFLLFWSMAIILFSTAAGLFWPSQDLQKYYPEVFTRLLVRATPAIMMVWALRFYKTDPNNC